MSKRLEGINDRTMLNQIILEDGPLQRLVFIVQIRKESEFIGGEAIF
nr:hypothetical protein [uncultured Cohaesibacter sp.]